MNGQVFIFDIQKTGNSFFKRAGAQKTLLSVLESNNVLKIVHDRASTTELLASLFKVNMAKIFDCQVAYCEYMRSLDIEVEEISKEQMIKEMLDTENMYKNDVELLMA